MTSISQALSQLRRDSGPASAGLSPNLANPLRDLQVNFAAVAGPLQQRWQQALRELDQCIRPTLSAAPVLNEGGVYDGTWLESTGTINAEVLSRFAPQVATDTFELFADHQREDGLMPYKVTPEGPAFSQIQLVTPLARSVWSHFRLNDAFATPQPGSAWLGRMYRAMADYDAWIAEFRDTRGTGAVEAFCTYDTGHDMSPRFWFAAERCRDADASRLDPDLVNLPYVAPDLTANIACQRGYLADIAQFLGEDTASWRAGAARSRAALYEHCFDPADACFFDLDAHGRQVRIRSDVLLRVAACEQVDEPLFTELLQRHLMRTSRFLSHFGFTSIAMDDPRFDADHTRNSWAGPVNFLTQLRAPHAFEHYGHLAELTLATRPLLAALAAADTFPQCVDGWSGAMGYTSVYSPSILWFLDAVERYFGILPTPGGGALLSGMAPTRLDHGTAEATAYSRRVGEHHYELAADDTHVEVYRDGQEHLRFPRGWRVEIDSAGEAVAVTGMAPRESRGTLEHDSGSLDLALGPNDRITFDQTPARPVTFVPPGT